MDHNFEQSSCEVNTSLANTRTLSFWEIWNEFTRHKKETRDSELHLRSPAQLDVLSVPLLPRRVTDSHSHSRAASGVNIFKPSTPKQCCGECCVLPPSVPHLRHAECCRPDIGFRHAHTSAAVHLSLGKQLSHIPTYILPLTFSVGGFGRQNKWIRSL